MEKAKTDTIKEINKRRELIKSGSNTPKMREQCKMPASDAVFWQAALILEGRRGIITRSQTKLDKAQGESIGYINRGLTLSSAREAREWMGHGFTACPFATVSCAFACVGSQTGQGALTSSKIARIGRTLALHVDAERFNALLDVEIESERGRAAVFGFRLAFRFNVASDHWKLADDCADRHPLVTFYDYTAIPDAMGSNSRVHRVYSRKDGKFSASKAVEMANDGRGVSVVFSTKKGESLPDTWEGVPVIDGDVNDLWFLRAPAVGAFVVGLRIKGTRAQMSQGIESGFAVAAQ